MKKILSFIVSLLAFVMIAGIFAQTFLPEGQRPTDWFAKQPTQEEEMPVEGEENPTVEGDNVMAVRMASVQTYAATEGVSKVLTAEIQPSSALNKAVDWTIAWKDGGESAAISEYLTISPASDGALTATLTCKKSFRGKEAVATVTTRDGGFTANCYISYAGEPSSLTVNGGSAGECYLANSSSFSVELTNVFGDVGEEFYDELIVEGVTFGGTCSTATKWVTVSGRNEGTVSYTDVKTNVSVSDLKFEGSSSFTDMFDVSLSGKTLTVTAPSLSGAYSSYSPAGAGNQDIYYDYYYGEWNGYADIVVSYGKYSFSTTFRVNFILGVEGVSVTPSLQF